VDAFASAPFRGNPTAVCPLDRWLKDETLQAIAAVDLCGHATLAAAHVILEIRIQ